ncbi:hypothetical protein BMT55_09800 [Listeria newyorkensis]|uniref:Lipase (Class 3) n=1 Tax=Listeria newyorkensis TaxID=1497681 RepID=A0ABX4XMF7_9LIST|nr:MULTISPECIES: lipase family protein [Listeria]KGL38139.1 hypothetical protein EP56_16725 [Listeriaceae bacterium FSL A5-0209]KGL39309.1 hypothetical protein EP58_14200 [Listeria newyorkensis]PNP91988.1 hypothetical protein BMT55_09800 [Listeria newyorkensis]WAO22257.1 lipase family protein [Listeria newyorkensis]SQC54466.1 Lipase (class 3) [Listeria newyorkensis]
MKITEETNFYLADAVYDSEVLRKDNVLTLKDIGKTKWITVNSVDNKNGLQAAAVVPLSEYKAWKAGSIKEFSHMVFMSRGSEEDADWDQNIKLATASPAQKDDQFITYNNFVNTTLSKHTTKDYSFTGHSLGGALAQYEAVKHTKPAVTFAAARSFNKLTPDEQAKAKDGAYFHLIKDFRHHGDVVGLLPPDAFVFYQQYYSKNGAASDPLNAHLTKGFRKQFGSNGATKLAISPDEIKALANRMKDVAADIDRMVRLIEDFRQAESDAVKKMVRKFNDATYGGEYDLLNENDVDDVMHDLAVKKTEGVYRFHNEEILHDLLNKLLERQYYLQQFANEIGNAGHQMQQTDINLGHDLDRTIGSLVGIAAGNAVNFFK